MADDNFDIDDIQLVKHNPDMILPEPRTSDTPESPQAAATKNPDLSVHPTPAPAAAQPPPAVQVPPMVQAVPTAVQPVSPVVQPPPAVQPPPVVQRPSVPGALPFPQGNQPIQTVDRQNQTFAVKYRAPQEDANPGKNQYGMKQRRYGLGCFVFSLVVSLLLGSGTAAVIRYKKPIVKQLKKVEKWMNDHGLAFDGGDAPWKRKPEKK